MSKTLLLADDSVTIQRVIELSFANEDVRVVSVADGRRAVQWIDAEHPDIVVADVGVPEVDGYGIVSHVKKSASLKHIPVVLLAGAFEPVDENRARSAGCDGILVKPFEPQQLVSRVKELLIESERFAPAAPMKAAAGGGGGSVRTVPVAPPAPPAPGPRAIVMEPPAPVQAAPPPPSPADVRTFTGSGSRRHQPPAFEVHPAEDKLEVDHLGAMDNELPHAVGERLEPPSAPIWTTPLAARADADAGPPKVSLANAFSALLAAEQSRPSPQAHVAAPEIPEAAIEEAVRRILARMTGEAVRQVVLDTAERLIREEIEKIKAAHSE
jgi:CheY-like chemotaxis protein